MSTPQATLVRLSPRDNVAVAVTKISEGTRTRFGVTACDEIAEGHKISLTRIPVGEVIRKYGQVIGVATTPIAAGAHVHTHNMAYGGTEASMPAGAQSTPGLREVNPATAFRGYRRSGGRAGTRNQIGIIASVNCSATVVHAIAEKAARELLAKYLHVEGVVPIAHQSGCGLSRADPGFRVLERTMKGFLEHPNFGGVLVIGLGCEVTGSEELKPAAAEPGRYQRFDIQEAGGTTNAIAEGIRRVEALMRVAEQDRRLSIPAAELIIGLQCGGSDGFSGITANPAMGVAVDQLTALGATALLSETPEIFGAEHLLLQRAETPEVAAALRRKIEWWQHYARQNGTELDNNPSPGNKKGGITTILEKSLGAVAKAGQSTLRDVIEYAQPLRRRGLVFMDSPGFDPCSATGQVASGANLLLFSTGRGSCFGCKPAPTIKLATNSEVYHRMRDDMDIDCGRILSGTDIGEVADEILARVLSVASGERTRSEALGYGNHEFVPWRLGAVL